MHCNSGVTLIARDPPPNDAKCVRETPVGSKTLCSSECSGCTFGVPAPTEACSGSAVGPQVLEPRVEMGHSSTGVAVHWTPGGGAAEDKVSG